MLPNVKANIKQQEIKDLVALPYNFFKKYLQNLKYNVKEGAFFNFIWFSLAFHPSWYCLLTAGVGGVQGFA